MFIKGNDGEFYDVSGLSGLDSLSDGRCIAVLDYDNDGFQDFLVANANAPSLSLYRNALRELGGQPNYISVKLIGGNDSNLPNGEYSSRDAIGARITVNVAGKKLVQQLSAGEGFAAQNQAQQKFGLGQNDKIDSIEVRWPSGKTQTITKAIDSHSEVTIYEKPKSDQREYSVASVEKSKIKAGEKSPHEPLELSGLETQAGKLTIVTSMATWCPRCKASLPELNRLKRRYPESLDLFAVAIDKSDSTEKLNTYVEANQPPYQLLPDSEENAVKFTQYVVSKFNSAKMPSTVIFSPQGKVLQILSRVPSVSDIELLKHNAQQQSP